MKVLRRNEQTDNRVNLSGTEVKHMKAVSLIEELDDRSKRRPRELTKGRNKSDLQQALNPKRLLCFSNKPKKDQDSEENQRMTDWRSRNIIDYKGGQILTFKDRRRNNGDLSALCNELCHDYYEIRKKLKNRPVVRNPKKVEVLDAAITGSNSTTSSSVDAPLRNFGVKKSRKANVHYSNENRELHRRQRSLLDNSGSGHPPKNKSSKRSTSKKSNHTRSSRSSSPKMNSIQPNSNRSKNSKRSDKSKSKSRSFSTLLANSMRSSRERPTQPQISMSESTADTIPVSIVERNSRRSGIHPDMSMISTMTSKSYSTYNDSSIILSPRGANDKVDKNLNQGQGGLLVCSSTPCTSRPQRPGHHISRNPSTVGVDLGTIREGDYYFTSSASSGSFSSYSSSSSGSYSDYSYSSSDREEDDDRCVSESNSHARQCIPTHRGRRKNKKNIANGCSTVTRSDVWNAIMHDESTIEERDDRY